MMILRLDELPNDVYSESEEVVKYFKDLKIMMEGILDLNRRGSLPELEKATTITLLLKISLKNEVFGDLNVSESKSWISTLEGSRKRTGRATFHDSFAVKASRKDANSQILSKKRSIRPTIPKKNRLSSGTECSDLLNDSKKRKKSRDEVVMMSQKSDEHASDFHPGKTRRSDEILPNSSASILLQQKILRGPINRDDLYDDDNDDDCDPYKTSE